MSKSIVKACVRYDDRLYTGFEHGECFKKLNEDNMIIVHSYIEQGFVDSDGNFVDRKQAMIIAKEAGQLRYEPSKKTLISEDLHLDWLNKQSQRIAELEEQLKNAIVPKFKKGQEVWFVYDDSDTWEADYEVFHKKVMAISYNNYEGDYFEYAMSDDGTRDTIWYGYIEERYVFATKEEALAKLEELKGENK